MTFSLDIYKIHNDVSEKDLLKSNIGDLFCRIIYKHNGKDSDLFNLEDTHLMKKLQNSSLLKVVNAFESAGIRGFINGFPYTKVMTTVAAKKYLVVEIP